MTERYNPESNGKISSIRVNITFTQGYIYPLSDFCLTYGRVISLAKEAGWDDHSKGWNLFSQYGEIKFERRDVILELRPYAKIYVGASLTGPYTEQSCIEGAAFSYNVKS